MTAQTEIITKIEQDLKSEPEKLITILNLWKDTQEQESINDNQPLPQEYEAAASENDLTATNFNGAHVGLPAYYNYDNYAAQQSNTCGQAVIGSFVDFFNKNPFGLQRTVSGHDGKMHFDNLTFIGKIFKDFGPNYPFPNGVTVRETILAACKHYGLKTHEWYPGSFSNGQDAKKQLTDWISKYRLPVAVLIDTGTPALGTPQPYTLHWCTVYAYDAGGVHIGTWATSRYVDWNTFMDAWHCKWLPYPNNFYQIRAWA